MSTTLLYNSDRHLQQTRSLVINSFSWWLVVGAERGLICSAVSGEGEEEQRKGREGRWTVQAVQTGAEAHVVPSARKKKRRWADVKPTAGRSKKVKGRRERGEKGRRAGVALHASCSIRRSRECPVHVDVSLRASVAGERQELPRAGENHTVLKTSQGTLRDFNAG